MCSMFREQDVFVGYNSDTTAAVVLQASSYAQKLEGTFDEEDTIKRKSLVCCLSFHKVLKLEPINTDSGNKKTVLIKMIEYVGFQNPKSMPKVCHNYEVIRNNDIIIII